MRWFAMLLLFSSCWVLAQAPPPAKPAAPPAAPAPATPPAPPAEETVAIQKTAEPVTVDGKLSEACWTAATAVPSNFIYGKGPKADDLPRMTAKFAWDTHYFYIAYETFDANLTSDTDGKPDQGLPDNRRSGAMVYYEGGRTPQVDLVEFFVTFNDPNFFWELHHNAQNHWNDIFVIAPAKEWGFHHSTMAGHWSISFLYEEYLKDDPGYTFQRAVQLKPKADGQPSTVNQGDDVDTGYTAEIRIPWRALGPNRKLEITIPGTDPVTQRPIRIYQGWNLKGQVLRILSAVQNGDAGERYFSSGKNIKGGFFHHNAAVYPRYELVE